MNRAPGENLKFATPFGSMFVHLSKNKRGQLVNVQISHQMKDKATPVVALIEAINAALRELAGD